MVILLLSEESYLHQVCLKMSIWTIWTDMPSIEMKFWLVPAVSLFTMFCLLKCIWNQWHNDVLFVYEDGIHDLGQHMKDPTGKVELMRISIQMQALSKVQAQSAVHFQENSKEQAQSAVHIGLNCPQIQKEDLDVSSIGKKLFDTFKDQRKLPWFDRLAKKQFAVVFLSSSKDNLLNSIKGGTNNNIKVFPPDDKLYNYVTARPHSGAHAEELIMEKFDELVKAYESAHKEPVQYIFLYTWLFPCSKCASAIIDTIIPIIQSTYPELLSDVAIFVLYSGVRKNEEEDKLITEQILRSHGINMWALGNIEEDS